MAALIPRPDYPPYNASGAIDAGREEVDEILRDMEQRVHREYEQAAREMNDKAYEYLMDFYEADMEQAARLRRGEISDEEYRNWRISHIATGRRWFEMAHSLASDMTQTNEIASGIINGYMPEVFACGFNYGLYQGEITGGFETSFTLYDRNTVMRLIAEEPDLLPLEAKINVPEDLRWNTQKIASCMTQSIMQGETIPQIAERMARTVGGMNERVAIRNARTATTSAENGGRYSGYRKLTEAGANLTIEWCATLDGRTRHEHRLLDGQRQNVDEPFEVDGMKILYAGDPRAPQGLIWNCRCTMLCWTKGFEESLMLKAQTNPDDMSYAEWKFAKQEEYEARKARAEARRNQPRVNPDNPSYGYASDSRNIFNVNASEVQHDLLRPDEINYSTQVSAVDKEQFKEWYSREHGGTIKFDEYWENNINGTVEDLIRDLTSGMTEYGQHNKMQKIGEYFAANQVKNANADKSETFTHTPFNISPTERTGLSVDAYESAKRALERSTGKEYKDEHVRELVDSVWLYTSGAYVDILAADAGSDSIYGEYYNMFLRNNPERLADAKANAENVSEFLNAAPKYEGKVYRAMGFDINAEIGNDAWEQLRSNLVEGGEVRMDSFSSWTTNSDTVEQILEHRQGLDDEAIESIKVVFEVEDSRSGVDIAEYADMEQHEVLFNSGSRFIVESVERIVESEDDYLTITRYKVRMREANG